MLINQTTEKLSSMKLFGMVDALQKQVGTPEWKSLSFDDRFGLLVDAEYTLQENIALTTRLQQAKLRHSACFEDIDLRNRRGLDRTVLSQLALCKWVPEGINILIDGPTGVGKSYMACAFAQKACRSGFTSAYFRAPRFFQELTVRRLGNRYTRYLKKLAKIDVIVLDDFGLAPMTDEQARDLLEVVDDRCGRRPMIIASQLPPDNWYATIPGATIADAILDRIIHSSHKLHMTGKSCRRNDSKADKNAATIADSPIDNEVEET
jgi:DNA replication protein DnaC